MKRRSLLSKDELEELKSLKRDLVDPVKSFVGEVYTDTVGDARTFYSTQARQAQQTAKLVQKKTEEQMSAFVQMREEQQKQRKAVAKRTAITLILLVLIGTVFISVALSARAEEPDPIRLGEASLAEVPPDYENAALCFRRAGINGNAEGYYRLAEMYADGLLTVGNPCADDLEALGAAEARRYYALAAQGGYEPAQAKLLSAYESITQEKARLLMEEDPSCLILDVRTIEEYDTGHIPGAVCIPVESITEPPEQLPNYDQTILIYCRSGRRSKEAAQKLAYMGYTHVMEFGGILDWEGETLTADEDSAFMVLTGLSRMAGALKEGHVIEKVYYTDGFGFSDSAFTTTEQEEIHALWDAVRSIQLGEASQMGITDWYPQIIFYLDNGQQFSVRFEGQWLHAGKNYELDQAEAFWSLTEDLVTK